MVTPSHNPPADGGFKYNPPDGGPADTGITDRIQNRANALLADGNRAVRRIPIEQALTAPTTHAADLAEPYIAALADAIDLDAIRRAGVRIGVDPLGGASLAYWPRIAERYGLDLTVVNPVLDPTFSFMPPDHDGKIRMDCSSPWAMAGLVGLKDRYDVAWGNDPDADRHGIVTPSAGLMNPNHYLAVAIHYLLAHRPGWPGGASIGKTVVSSSLIDRVVADAGRRLYEVPVGLQVVRAGTVRWQLLLRRGGECGRELPQARWPGVDHRQGRHPAWPSGGGNHGGDRRGPRRHYAVLTGRLGAPVYTRIDTPCTAAEKTALARLSAGRRNGGHPRGRSGDGTLTTAPGNGAPIGGLKVTTGEGWFAARPSGTEDVYKLYAESFRDAAHLERIVAEARALVQAVLRSAAGG